jgi:hypothetical protein
LNSYRSTLQQAGIKTTAIEQKLAAIKRQEVTSIFYFPANAQGSEDYIARLDELYSIPLKAHEAQPQRERVFNLSMVGFYLFLVKLSIHFCRFQEEVVRS